MKAITLTQPYASLVAAGKKRIETRSWISHYRGPLLIHAASNFPDEQREFARGVQVLEAMQGSGLEFIGSTYIYPRGQIIAICDLVDVQPMWNPSPVGGYGPGKALPEGEEAFADWVREMAPPGSDERAFGVYQPSRFGFFLEHIRPLKKPIVCKGALSLWKPPSSVIEELHKEGLICA